MRFLRHDMSVIASAYSPIVFTPCKILMFTKDKESGHLNVLATGVALPPNPLAIILKRIILTGYPLKVHKKRAVIRYMFFNPKDIKYFKPVELYTKFGLRVSKIYYYNYIHLMISNVKLFIGTYQRLTRYTWSIQGTI